MLRDEEIRTPLGQAAWSYYQKWMKSQRKAVHSIESFLTSKYYTTFIKFAQFAQKVGLPDTDAFIWYMTEKEIQPVIWVNDKIYESYINFVDTKSDPYQQAKKTFDFMFKIADEFECDISDIFNYLDANDVIQMLHRRQMSPWILLHSPKFKQFLINKVTDSERIIMESIIRPDYWGEKKTKNPEIVAYMKKFVRELDL
jgi:hypothetical protein